MGRPLNLQVVMWSSGLTGARRPLPARVFAHCAHGADDDAGHADRAALGAQTPFESVRWRVPGERAP